MIRELLIAAVLAGLLPAAEVGSSAAQRQAATEMLLESARDYARYGVYTRTPIRLGYLKAFSHRFTEAAGRIDINFETGQVRAPAAGLSPGGDCEVWLIENVPGPHNSAAIDFGAEGDRIIRLGALPPSGYLAAAVDPIALAGFQPDMHLPGGSAGGRGRDHSDRLGGGCHRRVFASPG